MYREFLIGSGEITQYRDITETHSIANINIPAMVILGQANMIGVIPASKNASDGPESSTRV